ncbi:MAG: dockerin type I domain-containing protein, partial [Candidatus Omnitrophota bacterium]
TGELVFIETPAVSGAFTTRLVNMDEEFYEIEEVQPGEYTVHAYSSGASTDLSVDGTTLTVGDRSFEMIAAAGAVTLVKITDQVTEDTGKFIAVEGGVYDVDADVDGDYTVVFDSGIDLAPVVDNDNDTVTFSSGNMYRIWQDQDTLEIHMEPLVIVSSPLDEEIVSLKYGDGYTALYRAEFTTDGKVSGFLPIMTTESTTAAAPPIEVDVNEQTATLTVDGDETVYEITKDELTGAVLLSFKPIRSAGLYNQRIEIEGTVYDVVKEPIGYTMISGEISYTTASDTEIVIAGKVYDILTDADTEDVRITPRPERAGSEMGAIKSTQAYVPGKVSQMEGENTLTLGGEVFRFQPNAFGMLTSECTTSLVDEFNYAVSGRKKVEIDSFGNVYEYLDEDYEGQGFGRIALVYYKDAGEYMTFSWDADQVTVDVYSGEYTTQGAAILSDIVPEETRMSLAYDHNGEMTDLDVKTNGWIVRSAAVYGADGTTIETVRSYDEEGRIIREDFLSEDLYKGYQYHEAPDEAAVSVIEEGVISTEELSGTEKYLTSGLLYETATAEAVAGYYTTVSSGGLVMREIYSSGDIREYLAEDYELSGKGRAVLEYSAAEGIYSTYAWESDRVTVNVYSGEYTALAADSIQSDVDAAELSRALVYEHNGELLNTESSTNGWIMREETAYDQEGGTAVTRMFDAAGRLTKEEIAGTGLYTTHSYHENGQLKLSEEYDSATRFLNRTLEYDEQGDLTSEEIASVLHGYYPVTGVLKRRIVNNTGDIFEFYEEDYNAQGFGRVSLSYDPETSTYMTYEWATDIVTVNVYSGEYVVQPDDAPQADVDAAERTATYVYYHNQENMDLDAETNGWRLFYVSEYQNDGVTLKRSRMYDSEGRLALREELSEARQYSYQYHDDMTGLGPAVSVVEKSYLMTGTTTDRFEYSVSGKLTAHHDIENGILTEYHPGSGFLKRETAGGLLFEYIEEEFTPEGRGRVTLSYDPEKGAYRTYDWGADTVTVTVYDGEYTITAGDSLRSGVVEAHKAETLVYDHDGEMTGLDPEANGWALKGRTVEDESGDRAAYVYDAAGRVTRKDNLTQGTSFIYVYHAAPDDMMVRYEYEYAAGEPPALSAVREYDASKLFTFTNVSTSAMYESTSEYTVRISGRLYSCEYSTVAGTMQLSEKGVKVGGKIYEVVYDQSSETYQFIDPAYGTVSTSSDEGFVDLGENLYAIEENPDMTVDLRERTVSLLETDYRVARLANGDYVFADIATGLKYTSRNKGSSVIVVIAGKMFEVITISPSEDIDRDGRLDEAEDVDGDMHLDLQAEDVDSDEKLDTGEVTWSGGYSTWVDADLDEIVDWTEDLDGDGNFDIEDEQALATAGYTSITYGEFTTVWIANDACDLDDDGRMDLGIEDLDGDENFDGNEDLDYDGNLDVAEDLDGDWNLDVDEDVNLNGRLDLAGDIDLKAQAKIDVDGDGRVDDEDVDTISANIELQKRIAKADVDSNGKIDFTDMERLGEVIDIYENQADYLAVNLENKQRLQDMVTCAYNTYLQNKALEFDYRKNRSSDSWIKMNYPGKVNNGFIETEDYQDFVEALASLDALFDYTQDGVIDEEDIQWLGLLVQLKNRINSYSGVGNITNVKTFLQNTMGIADVNKDGIVDEADQEMILNAYDHYLESDVSGDGIVNITDVDLVRNIYETIWPGAYNYDVQGVTAPPRWPDGGSRKGESVLARRIYAANCQKESFQTSPDRKAVRSTTVGASLAYTFDVSRTGDYYIGLSARNLAGQSVPEDFQYLVWVYVDGRFADSMAVNSSPERFAENAARLGLTAGKHEVRYVFKNVSLIRGIEVRDVYANLSGFQLTKLDTSRDGVVSAQDADMLAALIITYDVVHDDNRVDPDDVDYVQGLVGKTSLDIDFDERVDFNNDELIDEEDVTVIGKIIDENDTNADGKLENTAGLANNDVDRVHDIARFYMTEKAYKVVKGRYLLDFNGDEEIDLTDAMLYVNALSVMDLTGDDLITEEDRTMLAKVITMSEFEIYPEEIEWADVAGEVAADAEFAARLNEAVDVYDVNLITAEEPELRDGRVDRDDVELVKGFIGQITIHPSIRERIDFNGDNEITALDVQMIENAIAKYDTNGDGKVETAGCTFTVTDGATDMTVIRGGEFLVGEIEYSVIFDQEEHQMRIEERFDRSDVALGVPVLLEGDIYLLKEESGIITVSDGTSEYTADGNGEVVIGGRTFIVTKDPGTQMPGLELKPVSSTRIGRYAVAVDGVDYVVTEDTKQGQFIFDDGLTRHASNPFTGKIRLRGLLYSVSVDPATDTLEMEREKLEETATEGACLVDGREYTYSYDAGVYTFVAKDGRSFASDPASDIILLDGVAFQITGDVTELILTELYSARKIADGAVKVGGVEYLVKENANKTYTFAGDGECVLSDRSGDAVVIGGYEYKIIIKDAVTGQVSLEAVGKESVSVADQLVEIVKEYQGIRTRGVQYRVSKNPQGRYVFSCGNKSYTGYEKDGDEYMELDGYCYQVTEDIDGKIVLQVQKPTINGVPVSIYPNMIAKRVADEVVSLDGKEYTIKKNDDGSYTIGRGTWSGDYTSTVTIDARVYDIVEDASRIKLVLDVPEVDTSYSVLEVLELQDSSKCYVTYDGSYTTTGGDVTGYTMVPLGDGAKVIFTRDSQVQTVDFASAANSVVSIGGRTFTLGKKTDGMTDVFLGGYLYAGDMTTGSTLAFNGIEYKMSEDAAGKPVFASVPVLSNRAAGQCVILGGNLYLLNRDAQTGDFTVQDGETSYLSHRYKVVPVAGEAEDAVDGDPTYSGAAKTNLVTIKGNTYYIERYQGCAELVLEQLHLESAEEFSPGDIKVDEQVYRVGHDFSKDVFTFTNTSTGDKFESDELRRSVRLEGNVLYDIYI